MTVQEFQANHSGDLKRWLETPAGQAFFNLLNSMRPPYEFPMQEHLLIENRGVVRGYEMCLRNTIVLTMPPKIVTQPEANYGVPDHKPEEKK